MFLFSVPEGPGARGHSLGVLKAGHFVQLRRKRDILFQYSKIKSQNNEFRKRARGKGYKRGVNKTIYKLPEDTEC